MSNIEERQQKLVEEFSKLTSWEDRYKRIIAMGKDLPKGPEDLYDDKLLVKGCQSRVWLKAGMEDGKMVLLADSDALIVKGLVALLLKVYSQSTPQEIMGSSPEFIKELGFANYLSPSRANGFMSMVKQIILYAQALSLTAR